MSFWGRFGDVLGTFLGMLFRSSDKFRQVDIQLQTVYFRTRYVI